VFRVEARLWLKRCSGSLYGVNSGVSRYGFTLVTKQVTERYRAIFKLCTNCTVVEDGGVMSGTIPSCNNVGDHQPGICDGLNIDGEVTFPVAEHLC